MLTERFIASILRPDYDPTSHTHKNSGIFIHDYQPLPSLKSTFEKSSTKPSCLAVTSSHVFAAQSDNSAVLVYTIGRKSPDLVPFPERISSLALIGGQNDGSILALGTEEGRAILWELCTGRQISTPRTHLQAISCLAVDATSNFLLTGSPDSRIHAWSIPALLSYSSPAPHGFSQPGSNAPLRSLLNHRAAITSLTTGHSHTGTDIAISGSRDNTCIVWDYRTGTLLHTFILYSAPICLALDPADRAFYAGFDDGSIQLVDLYTSSTFSNFIQNAELSATPTQPNAKDRWLPDSPSSALALAVSYDGTTILSGHEDGKIHAWDVAQGRIAANALSNLSAPVTNIIMLSPSGFPVTGKPKAKMVALIKPWHGEAPDNDTLIANGEMIPETYSFTAQFVSPLLLPRFMNTSEKEVDNLMSDFDVALSHCSVPNEFWEDSIQVFNPQNQKNKPALSISADNDLLEEVSSLKDQLARSRAMQSLHVQTAANLGDEVIRLQKEREMKQRAKRIKRIKRAKAEEIIRKKAMGERLSEAGDDDDDDDDEDMEEQGELSSTTDELTDSD